MIDIQQLTSLISAFRVETEKSVIKWVQCHACMSIAERERFIQTTEKVEKMKCLAIIFSTFATLNDT